MLKKYRQKRNPSRTSEMSGDIPKGIFPQQMQPMLASLADKPFSGEGWLFEPKYDGIRALAFIEGDKVKLQSRRGLDLTERYPELVRALSKHVGELVLDGEIVALDEEGHPSFHLLQQTSGDGVKTNIPIHYYAFDLLFLNGQNLVSLSIKERKKFLQKILRTGKLVHYVDAVPMKGNAAFDKCVEEGFEGIVAKKADGIYEPGRRSKSWLKVKAVQSADFVICGYSKGAGNRSNTFGALLLGSYHPKDGTLKYVGSVGTGFNSVSQTELLKQMNKLKAPSCPFEEYEACKEKVVWIKPVLVAEIKYAELTQSGKLRLPVFQRLREDIAPAETGIPPSIKFDTVSSIKLRKNSLSKKVACRKLSEIRGSEVLQLLDEAGDSLNLETDGYTIAFTNLDRELWPAQGKQKAITKRDYAQYLIRVAPYILPHLEDRLLTLIRFPAGISEQRFFQKHWSHKLPEYVHSIEHYSEQDHMDKQYLICDNIQTLLWLAQNAVLELHAAHTRINSEPDAKNISQEFTGSPDNIKSSLLNYPDYLVLDLDPYLYSGKEAKNAEPELHKRGFRKTCDAALWLKELLDGLAVPSFVKTTGRTGLHIYVPIVRNVPYEIVRDMAAVIGKHLMQKHLADITMDWAVVKRRGKVFFDHNMNGRGKTLAAPYSPRSSAEAAVSMPLKWDELNSIYPTDFTIRSVPERLEKEGDPWANILLAKSDLYKKLHRGSI